MSFVYLILGFLILILGGNWLLKSAVALSLKLSIPKIIIGMTVVSLATSAPELIVSLTAAVKGSTDLSLSNVIGSNIANLGLVLGITLLLGNMEIKKSFYKTDWPMMMMASVLLFFFIGNDDQLNQTEGFVLFGLLIAFLVYLLRFQKTAVVDEFPDDDEELPLFKTVLYFAIGSIGLWSGSELLVRGAISIAQEIGVSERIIGITIVSLGTSIPELAASNIAFLKKEKAISLGNLIGSNIFNILAVLGLTAIITPVKLVDQKLMSNDIYWMLGIAFLVLPLVFLPKGSRLNYKDGIVLLISYIIFIFQTV
ncbi:MAG: calcium/sodium antiporter [Polaribacter sp.]